MYSCNGSGTRAPTVLRVFLQNSATKCAKCRVLVAWPRIEAYPRDCAINTVSAAKKLHECFRIVLILNCACLVRCCILLSACNGENCRSILLYCRCGQGAHSDAERHGKRNNGGKQTAWNFYNYQMLLLACRLWHS